MSARILDGQALAAEMRAEIAAEAEEFARAHGFRPQLTAIQIGESRPIQVYLRQIQRAFHNVDLGFYKQELPEETELPALLAAIERLNREPAVSGILVGMPLPAHLPGRQVAEAIDLDKDVDGVHPNNAGRLLWGEGEYFAPATPSGGLELLRRAEIDVAGKKAVVVGRSNIVGKPMAVLLLHEHATVTVAHSRTPDLGAVTRTADILVSAAGKPKLITADMVRPGAVVIDFGVNVVDGQLVGDVDFEAVKEVAGAITPVPGGTGPLTNIMLMR
ncbi:MAG: bifunctional 5,10-methylene-tetrahydrofolate dehydrogenase/5,10-methylene-tetrahydrofolate cyclohydrolase, partial [Chloroflexi bacterium]|nr:bifunctional 5,10-methylene-tetrahydrofolate dehydrogenase/5,10-methylene-tetrahydrofolate cyclohydrolase [Chloroflexota bacterium]